jgi:hypothetical protein
MYATANPFVDKYKLMQRQIEALLPAYVIETEERLLAAKILQEFADMEQARATVVGVDDPSEAVVGYLDHHFFGAPKPLWYRNLTE